MKLNNKRHSVIGIFNDKASLNHAVEMLKSQNFRNSDISVLFQSPESSHEIGFEKYSKAPEGAAVGAVTGIALGGALGWLIGAGMLAIPGLGPLVIAGPIIAAIAGAGAGGTVGVVTGGLVGLGLPQFVAESFEGHIKEGGMLISIHVDNETWESKAIEILKENGAKNITTTSEKKSTDPFYYKKRIDQEYEDQHP